MAAETRMERVKRLATPIMVSYRAHRWAEAMDALAAARAEFPSDSGLDYMAAQILRDERAATVRSPF
jgi:hypothetical protein